MTENGPRCQDLTISGHDLSHLEVREGCAALSKVEEGSDGLGFQKFSLEGFGFRKSWVYVVQMENVIL